MDNEPVNQPNDPGIGSPGRVSGSLVPAILGISPWATPVDAYLRLIGEAPPQAANKAMKRGIRAERYLLDWYEEEAAPVRLQRGPVYVRHSTTTWADGHLDGYARFADGWRLVEAKSVSQHAMREWGAPGTDEMPMYYVAQVLWYLYCTKLNVADVVAAFNFDDVRLYRVERDADTIAAMLFACQRFLADHVLPRKPPALTSPSDVVKLYPRDDGTAREATQEEMELISALRVATINANGANAVVEELTDKLKQAMLGASALYEPGTSRRVVTWREQSREILDTASLRAADPDLVQQFTRVSKSRVFRITKPRGEET